MYLLSSTGIDSAAHYNFERFRPPLIWQFDLGPQGVESTKPRENSRLGVSNSEWLRRKRRRVDSAAHYTRGPALSRRRHRESASGYLTQLRRRYCDQSNSLIIIATGRNHSTRQSQFRTDVLFGHHKPNLIVVLERALISVAVNSL